MPGPDYPIFFHILFHSGQNVRSGNQSAINSGGVLVGRLATLQIWPRTNHHSRPCMMSWKEGPEIIDHGYTRNIKELSRCRSHQTRQENTKNLWRARTFIIVGWDVPHSTSPFLLWPRHTTRPRTSYSSPTLDVYQPSGWFHKARPRNKSYIAITIWPTSDEQHERLVAC